VDSLTHNVEDMFRNCSVDLWNVAGFLLESFHSHEENEDNDETEILIYWSPRWIR
jgi:hypothetical protein